VKRDGERVRQKDRQSAVRAQAGQRQAKQHLIERRNDLDKRRDRIVDNKLVAKEYAQVKGTHIWHPDCEFLKQFPAVHPQVNHAQAIHEGGRKLAMANARVQTGVAFIPGRAMRNAVNAKAIQEKQRKAAAQAAAVAAGTAGMTSPEQIRHAQQQARSAAIDERNEGLKKQLLAGRQLRVAATRVQRSQQGGHRGYEKKLAYGQALSSVYGVVTTDTANLDARLAKHSEASPPKRLFSRGILLQDPCC